MAEAIPPVLEAYLLSHRGAMAPVIGAAIGSLGLPGGGTVLDAGTGAGGALGPLAVAVPCSAPRNSRGTCPRRAPATTSVTSAGWPTRV